MTLDISELYRSLKDKIMENAPLKYMLYTVNVTDGVKVKVTENVKVTESRSQRMRR